MIMKSVNCEDCGKVVRYRTKKPKWCAACKKTKPKIYRKKRGVPTRSKSETAMKYVLNELFPRASYIDGGYYSFMLSPKNAPLQLDRYYPKLALAFEYDGAQHDHYNSFVHKSLAEFDYLQACDRIKDAKCKELKIRLVRVKHDMKVTKETLVKLLEDLGLLEELHIHMQT